MCKLVIIHYRPKTPTTICTAITSSASTTPTVKAIFCSIMRRKIFKRQRFQFSTTGADFHLHFHTFRLLLSLDSGSFAASGNFLAIPPILLQKDFFRPASFSFLGFGAGGLRLCPSAFALARPFAFKPPFGFLPSALCHAGVFAMSTTLLFSPAFAQAIPQLPLLDLQFVYQSSPLLSPLSPKEMDSM